MPNPRGLRDPCRLVDIHDPQQNAVAESDYHLRLFVEMRLHFGELSQVENRVLADRVEAEQVWLSPTGLRLQSKREGDRVAPGNGRPWPLGKRDLPLGGLVPRGLRLREGRTGRHPRPT